MSTPRKHLTRRRQTGLALSGALMLATPLAAQAVIVEYSFEGRISSFSNNTSAFGSELALLDSVTATLKYDTDLVSSTSGATTYNFPGPTSNPATPETSAFYLDILLDGRFRGTGADGSIQVLNGSSSGQDWFQPRTGVGDGFVGDAINGLTWTQTDFTLKDYSGTLYSNTDLPNSIAELNNFDEKFFQATFKDASNNYHHVNVEIETITAALSTALIESDVPVNADDFEVLPPSQEHGGSGGVNVTLPANLNLAQGQTDVAFEAQYTQQPVSELDLSGFNFLIPGDNFQTWELHMDNALIPEGELVELVFEYDDTGMSLFEELTLDILHFVNGTWTPLGGTVDTLNNTITAFTPSFSGFLLASDSQVPAPGALALMLIGLAAWRRRKSVADHGQYASFNDRGEKEVAINKIMEGNRIAD